MTDSDGVFLQFVAGSKSDVPSQPHALGVINLELHKRFLTVWPLAEDVWGDEETAAEFMRRRHAMLHDRRPIDVVLESDEGAQLVHEILGRLKYGTAA